MSSPDPQHRLTARAFGAGSILAVLLCAVNSFLTLKFGIMEEGPAIAAFFFFAIFVFSSTKIAVSEMVIVATMGSAGGSLGFMANFFAAHEMVIKEQGGVSYSIFEMTTFSIVSSIVGLIGAILLRQILVIQNTKLPKDQQLPWVGAQAVKGMIDTLVTEGERRQALYLVSFLLLAILYVVFNDNGVGWVPEVVFLPIAGLATYGLGIYTTPFVLGAAYLMGMRTCVGFLVGGAVLLVMGPYVEPYVSASHKPHEYLYPGVMFLVTSGLTALAIHWRMISDAIKSLFNIKGGQDDDPIMSKKALIVFIGSGISVTMICLHFQFYLALKIIVAMLAIGGLVLNLVAARAYAKSYFNPIRVTGVLQIVINAALGGAAAPMSLLGGGLIAGSGSQSANMTSDFAYGLWYRIKSSWQFWSQAVIAVCCSGIAAVTFHLIRSNFDFALKGDSGLDAPIAKMWALAALLFDPSYELQPPPFAMEAMLIGGTFGVIWALLESKEIWALFGSEGEFCKFIPGSIGVGLGLVLYPFADFGFFLSGIVMLVILPRVFKVRNITLNSLAVACLIGEGMGGIVQAIYKLAQ